MKPCKRCGKQFDPEKTKQNLRIHFKMETNFCIGCMIKNIFDALELPTPPDMIDPYTKRPTLTDDEFRKELHKK